MMHSFACLPVTTSTVEKKKDKKKRKVKKLVLTLEMGFKKWHKSYISSGSMFQS